MLVSPELVEPGLKLAKLLKLGKLCFDAAPVSGLEIRLGMPLELVLGPGKLLDGKPLRPWLENLESLLERAVISAMEGMDVWREVDVRVPDNGGGAEVERRSGSRLDTWVSILSRVDVEAGRGG